jgi:hypothetical protein
MPAVRFSVAPSLVALLGCLAVWSSVANAEEYRLQVANLYRTAFAHFIDGPIWTGSGELAMPGLERSLDSGEMQPGALLTDRPLRYGWNELVNGFGAVKVRASVNPGEGPRRWTDEAVWEGKPGEKSVWVIASSATNHQEVYQVALNGQVEGLRYFVPYNVTGNPRPEPVVAYPLVFLRFHSDRGGLWNRYLSRSVALDEGLAAVIGVNDNPSFADWVYLVVEHPPKPTTFKAVIGWERRRSSDRSNFEGVGVRR